MRFPPSRSVPVFILLAALTLPACARERSPVTPGPQAAEDPVRVGYGTQRQADVTGSVASLDRAEIDRIQGRDMERLLQGRIAGLLVLRRGGDVSLSIRGGGTPHVVIDGAPASAADLLALPPETVQRIDVRKDGGAAVYGFRGGSGVIEVTLRRGGR